MVVSDIISKYNSLLETKDSQSLAKLSEMMNEELLHIVTDNLSDFYTAYLDLIKKAEQFILLGSQIKFEADGSAYLTVRNRRKKQIEILSAQKLYHLLTPDEKSKDLEKLGVLFLSNEKNIVYLNICVHGSLY